MTTNVERKRPGRPPGTSDTRERILESARNLFARNGIDKTSIRAIAARTPASTPRWCTTTSAPRPSCSPRLSTFRSTPWRSSVRCETVPVEQIGYTLPSILLPLWDSEMGKGFIATLRSILAGNEVSLIRSFLQEVIAVEVGSRVDNPPAADESACSSSRRSWWAS